MRSRLTPEGVRAWVTLYFCSELLAELGLDVDALKNVATPPLQLLLQVRRQRRSRRASPPAATRASLRQLRGAQRCGTCGEHGHKQRTCPLRARVSRAA